LKRLLFHGKLLKDYSRAYRELSSYVHSSVEGWTELLVPRGADRVLIQYDPYFEKSEATNALTFLMFLSKITVKPILMSFKSEIQETKLSSLSEIQKKIDLFLPSDTVS